MMIFVRQIFSDKTVLTKYYDTDVASSQTKNIIIFTSSYFKRFIPVRHSSVNEYIVGLLLYT